MTIMPIQSIAFKSLEKEKKYIKTPNDFSKFMRKYEPIFQETNSSYANLKEHISGAEYMKRRADKHISEQILLADPIEGSVKLGVDGLKEGLDDFRKCTSGVTNYYYKQILDEGLNQYAGNRSATGIYEFKMLGNSQEVAQLQHNHKKNYFRIIIKDKNNIPQRWYFFVNDYYIKNYDPQKGFDYSLCKYGQKEDVEAIKKILLQDLQGIKSSIEKSCKFMQNNKTYQKILLKK